MVIGGGNSPYMPPPQPFMEAYGADGAPFASAPPLDGFGVGGGQHSYQASPLHNHNHSASNIATQIHKNNEDMRRRQEQLHRDAMMRQQMFDQNQRHQQQQMQNMHNLHQTQQRLHQQTINHMQAQHRQINQMNLQNRVNNEWKQSHQMHINKIHQQNHQPIRHNPPAFRPPGIH